MTHAAIPKEEREKLGVTDTLVSLVAIYLHVRTWEGQVMSVLVIFA